jgi:peptide/nickel transport system ATP-binding protein/oligopeptide transport system ATP-binding protein
VKPLLSIDGLHVTFPGPRGPLRVLDGIDLDVREGEVLGIVGESGSGKSMTLRAIMRLIRAPGRVEGRIVWRDVDLLTASEARMREVRGREIAMIFQEPMSALNPVLTVGSQIVENIAAHAALRPRARRDRAAELLDLVGIPDARRRLGSYPHEFSGGMRQRAMIAIALAAEPRLLLADEPTTALDVTIQDQILKLLLRLREQLGMAVVLVTHDLGVVAQSCDRMAVMYAGRICEVGGVADVLEAPLHAYTLGLLRSLPEAADARRPLLPIPGAPPDAGAAGESCAFAPRCAFVMPACTAGRPRLRRSEQADRATSCLAADRLPRRHAEAA